MTLRERVLAVLNRKKPDKVPWLGDLDYWIYYLNESNSMPDNYKSPDGIYRLHQDLGVGFYLQGYFPFKDCYEGVRVKDEYIGDICIKTVETPIGNIREVWHYSHESYCWGPKEFFIKDTSDLKVLRYWYEHTYFEPDYKLAEERRELVGENGLVLCYTPKSPFMELAALKAGIEVVTYAILDDPDELEETLTVLERKHDEAAGIALHSPAECLMIPENLSSEVVGKSYYEKYMRSYEEKWIKRIRDAGKFSFIHMDGTLRGLIKEVSSAGFNVLEALTPSPVGDIEIGDIQNWVCNDTIIWGGIPGVYFTDHISDSDFDKFVIGVLEIMRKDSRYVLGVADQVPPKARFERIKKVSELVEKYGRYE
jgi:uroporphyrinogen-III decarboxylase